MDGLYLNVILMFLPIMILPYGSHCIDMTPNPEPINGATLPKDCRQSFGLALPARGCHALQRVIGWELSCTCLVTSLSQVHNVDDQNMVVFPIVGGWLAMLTEENLPSKYNMNEMKSM